MYIVTKIVNGHLDCQSIHKSESEARHEFERLAMQSISMDVGIANTRELDRMKRQGALVLDNVLGSDQHGIFLTERRITI